MAPSIKDQRLTEASKSDPLDVFCLRCINHVASGVSSWQELLCKFGEDENVLVGFEVGDKAFNKCYRCISMNEHCFKVPTAGWKHTKRMRDALDEIKTHRLENDGRDAPKEMYEALSAACVKYLLVLKQLLPKYSDSAYAHDGLEGDSQSYVRLEGRDRSKKAQKIRDAADRAFEKALEDGLSDIEEFTPRKRARYGVAGTDKSPEDIKKEQLARLAAETAALEKEKPNAVKKRGKNGQFSKKTRG